MNLLKRAYKIHKERGQRRTVKYNLVTSYKELVTGSYQIPGIIQSIRNLGYETLIFAYQAFFLLTAWLILPMYHVYYCLNTAYDTEKHLANCDGCKKCSHMPEQKNDEDGDENQ